jgi:uncharacterized protein YicC (UPF0701 family)
MALISMTGHADLPGASGALAWTWEARSVNGRGLDLRLRLPDGFEPIDSAIRAAAAAVFSRGSITVSLRLGAGQGSTVPRLNRAALEAVLNALQSATAAAEERGIDLAPATPADLLGLRGVLEFDQAGPAESPEVASAIRSGIEPLFAALAAARRQEGAALVEVLGSADRANAHVLIGEARVSAEARAARTGELLGQPGGSAAGGKGAGGYRTAGAGTGPDRRQGRRERGAGPARRPCRAGRGADPGRRMPVGRKLDFLMQEFNREANTLCSKAGSAELTAVGLEMKAVIDQMREQVQNVE